MNAFGPTGVFSLSAEPSSEPGIGYTGSLIQFQYVKFNSANVFDRIGNEIAPAWLAVNPFVTY